MWFMEEAESGGIAKTVVFNEGVMREYLEAGYKVTGKYKIELLEGDDFLPDYIGDE